MKRLACCLAALLFAGCQAAEVPSTNATVTAGKLPDGVYAVRRESLKEADVLPPSDGEALVVNRYRYLQKDEGEPLRFVVVHSAPEVALDLARPPEAVKEGDTVVRILLKLQPEAATALERLTNDHVGREIAIVLGGEVVTMHKVREVIRGGDVQITSCAAGAADHLLQQLEAHAKPR